MIKGEQRKMNETFNWITETIFPGIWSIIKGNIYLAAIIAIGLIARVVMILKSTDEN